MSLTANFDYCVELGIASVREIFHLAFKSEDRYPHNVGPFARTLSGREFSIEVRVHDDEDRPSELDFQDEKHMLFTFPFDLTAETEDAPDPSLSRITLQVVVEIPGKLNTWPEDGEDVLGIDFTEVTASDVTINSLEGLPTIDISNFLNAVHNKYDQIAHTYDDPPSGSTLMLYDGNRDNTLIPPNAATPYEIEAALETHGSDEYLKITAPIHVTINLPSGGQYTSYGRIIFWREVVTADTSITVEMGTEPTDASLQTQVELDDTAGQTAAEEAEINAAIHDAYQALPNRTFTLGNNSLVLYDDNLDPTLVPENLATPNQIESELVMHDGGEYLKVTMPIHVSVPAALSYTSYGRIIFHRAVSRTATTLSVNMGSEPADADLAIDIQFDSFSPVSGTIISALTPLVNSALAGFSTVNGPSFGAVSAQLRTMAIGAINGYGTITEPAFSESAARDLLREEIADYINDRRYPVYSPKSPDPDEPLSTPVGFLLVADGVMAILMNRRTGTAADDHAPDNFLGSDELALGVGLDKVYEFIDDAVLTEFDGLSGSRGNFSGSHKVETEEGDATLKNLTVHPADPGDHGESEGHLWITGKAEVHIDCWPDPTAEFDGPVFIDATSVETEEGCELDVEGRAGDFDIDQSCCDVLIDWLIIIVGWIMFFVIEATIDSVGGELAEEIAGEQGRQVEAIPPVVNGIAEVTACLTDVKVSSQGFVMPGEITIRRLGRSYEDLEEDHDLPRP